MALQPNFAILNNAIGQFSTEICKLQNMPQMDGAQEILNTLQLLQQTIHNINNNMEGLEARLNDNMAGLEARLNNNMAGLEARLNNRIEGLEARFTRRMKASARNEIARSQNSTRNMGVSPLVPLVHAATGDAINGFPVTVAALNSLQGAGAKAILRALEEPDTGTVPECRTRLMIAIGVVNQAL